MDVRNKRTKINIDRKMRENKKLIKKKRRKSVIVCKVTGVFPGPHQLAVAWNGVRPKCYLTVK